MTLSVAAARTSFDPLGAGALLLAVLCACALVGGLVGWAAGSVGIGIGVGAAAGIPIGVLAVYRRYRGYFTG